MTRTAREKYLLAALCVVLGTVAFYRLGVGIAWPRYLELRERLVTEIETLAQTRREVQRLPALKEEVAGARIKLRELRQPFEAVGREGALTYLLHLLPAGVQLRELVPETDEDKGYYRVSPVRLRLVGPFPEVQVFLDKLEALPVYIRDLRMGPVEDGSGIEVEVKLDLFFRSVAPAAASSRQVFGVALRDPFAAPIEAVSTEPRAAVTGGTTGAQTEVRKVHGRVPEGGASEAAAVVAPPREVSDGRRQEEEATTPEASYVWPKGEGPDALNRQYTFPVRR
ncbi:MAG: type 4a pilus biogenesis protein PilO [Moorellales bacterium]